MFGNLLGNNGKNDTPMQGGSDQSQILQQQPPQVTYQVQQGPGYSQQQNIPVQGIQDLNMLVSPQQNGQVFQQVPVQQQLPQDQLGGQAVNNFQMNPNTPVVQQQNIQDPSQSGVQIQNQSQLGLQGTQNNDPTQVQDGIDPEKRQDLTALSRLDPRSTQVVYQATEEAKRIKQAFIEPEQLLYGLLYDRDVFQLLEQFSVDVATISKEVQQGEKMGEFTGQPTLSEVTKQIIEQAFETTKGRGASFISPEDILLALFNAAGATSTFLNTKGIQKEKVEEKLSKSANYSVAKKTMLDKFGIDLTEQARQGLLDPVTGRDKEVERVIHIILRRTKNNPLLIGEAGVGKTAIVEALAQKIIDGSVPQELKNKKIIQLELASLVAGASHRGEFEERLRNIIREVQAANDKVLFIDEIHTLIGAGDSDGALDASNIIKPYLARGSFQLIGTTTTAEFRKYFEKDKAFARRFQPIIVEEPQEDVAVEMLKVLKPKYEKFHNVTFSDDSLVQAVKLSKKYIGERLLPDKAIDVLDEAAAEVKLQCAAGKRTENVIKKQDIETVISNWTGIPITKLTEDESQKLLKLEDLIHKRFIDQEEAVVAVAEAVRRGRIGLSNTNRPIASFIFLGPTGVGKTELAKTLAEILFGKDDAMIRLDMSEYMEKHEVAKLIGAPPGYVGYEEGGQLTEAVRAKPYSIVLLDEVEKAHPDVFNILLQLLEDGRLTDNKGNTISFKNTIVIGTSNIGSSLIQQKLMGGNADKTPEQAEKEYKELHSMLQEELIKFFRPELLNRFDGTVVFKPLSKKDMTQVTRLSIEKTQKLLKEQGFDLFATDSALRQLAEEGYDPVYGARPLRRLIQTAIENPISLHLISKEFVHGDTIKIDYDTQSQKYIFTKGSPQEKNQVLSLPENQKSDPNQVAPSSQDTVEPPSQPENVAAPQQQSPISYSQPVQQDSSHLPEQNAETPTVQQVTNSSGTPSAGDPQAPQQNYLSGQPYSIYSRLAPQTPLQNGNGMQYSNGNQMKQSTS